MNTQFILDYIFLFRAQSIVKIERVHKQNNANHMRNAKNIESSLVPFLFSFKPKAKDKAHGSFHCIENIVSLSL